MDSRDEYERAWREDPQMKDYVQQVLDDMVPKMGQSALVMQLVPDEGEGDVKFWVELGASIMMNKPIIAISVEGREIPEKLKLIADEIVYLPNGVDDEAGALISAAAERVIGTLES